jgi:hypothetical protein
MKDEKENGLFKKFKKIISGKNCCCCNVNIVPEKSDEEKGDSK